MKMQKKKKTYPLDQSPLYKLANHRRLAELLRLEVRVIHQLARAQRAAYSIWKDTNDKGKVRTIENPFPRLKRAQSRIATLLALIEPPDFLTCPVKGRSYVSNARVHIGALQIVTLDVTAYFQSTTWNRVYWFFHKRMMTSSDVAWTIASLATLEGHLPTGSPLSPILAYFAHQDTWLSVQRRVRDAGCKITLYMDDLTLSGDVVPDGLIWRVKQDIHSVGLRLNNGKQRRYGGGEALVTGSIVTSTGLRPTKGSHLKLKMLLDECNNTRDSDARTILLRRIRGLKAQHKQIQNPPKPVDPN